MAKPTLYLGLAGDPHLCQADSGFTDAGSAYNLFARTDRVALAGESGECVFTALYLVLVHRSATTIHLRITPLVDDVPLPSHTLTLPGAAFPATDVYELGLSVPVLDGLGNEVSRTAPRGTWLQVQIETIADGVSELLGALRVDGVIAEYDVVSESRTEAA